MNIENYEGPELAAILEDRLQEALLNEGQDPKREFKVPGTTARFDFYIPTLPRSVIEMRVCRSASEALKYATALRNRAAHSPQKSFGGNLLHFYVVFGAVDRNTRLKIKALRFPLIHIVCGGALSGSVDALAGKVAREIRDIRASHNPVLHIQLNQINNLEELVKEVDETALAPLVKSIKQHGLTDPLLVLEQFDGEGYDLIDGRQRVAALQRLKDGGFAKSNNELVNKIPVRRISKALSPRWNEPQVLFSLAEPEEGVKEALYKPPPPDVRARFAPLLQPLFQLVHDNTLCGRIDDELARLCEEHDEAHYTSCALRVGRLLEYVVYCLAQAWGVTVNEPMLKMVEILDQEAKEINRLFLDYDDTADAKKEQHMTRLTEKIDKLSARLHALSRQSAQPTAAELSDRRPAPRNVDAILRDFKKAHGANKMARKELDAIKDEKLVETILTFRNTAAHASAELEAQEVDVTAVNDMIDKLRHFLQHLINVGEAIRRPETGV